MTKTFSNLFKLMVTYLLKSHCPEGDPRLWNINGVGGKVFSYINDIRFPVFCVFAHQKLKGYEFHKNIHCYLIHRWSLISKHFDKYLDHHAMSQINSHKYLYNDYS